ncbi:MAG: hypothetical protein PHT91_01545 [Candidatus Nanoarchaeia archaeon]|nr:hypothetical protein [Candidatus Nanoarchaeia archaeon]
MKKAEIDAMKWIDAAEFNKSREAFLSEYFYKKSENNAKRMIDEHGSFSECLFDLGKKAGYYAGSFNWSSFPERKGSNNRLAEALGITESHLGYISFSNGFQFKGPFVYEKNYFNKPWLIRSWNVKIELENGQFISFNPVKTMKAILWNDRELISDHLEFGIREMQLVYEGMSKKIDKYSDHFDFSFKSAQFTGETLNAGVESASNDKTRTYNVAYQNPALEEIEGLRFKDSIRMNCGCGDKILGSDTKFEHVRHDYACKHILALMHLAKYYPENIRIEKPKGKIGHLNNLFTCFDLQETSHLPGGKEKNSIYSGVNSYLLWKIFKERKTMYSAEYELLKNVGIEYLLSPFLQDHCFNNMSIDLIERTAVLSGNVDNIDAVLMSPGSRAKGVKPKYYAPPIILSKNVKAPLFSASIPAFDNDGAIKTHSFANVSISPLRQKYTIEFFKEDDEDLAFDPRSSHFYLRQPKQGISPDWNAFTDNGVISFSEEKAAFLRAKNKSGKN